MTDRATIDPRASASHGTRTQEDGVTTKKVGRILAAMAAAALLAFSGLARAEESRPGILLLAHGAHAHPGHGRHSAARLWNANVEQLARGLDRQRPTEVAFGMADPRSIQAAVDRLERREITEIAVIPLFISSHSPIIGNFRYVLGLQAELARTTRLRHLDRVSSRTTFRFGAAMDAHPLVSEILLERALAVTTDPAATSVVLIAHGPNDDGERADQAQPRPHGALARPAGDAGRSPARRTQAGRPSEIRRLTPGQQEIDWLVRRASRDRRRDALRAHSKRGSSRDPQAEQGNGSRFGVRVTSRTTPPRQPRHGGRGRRPHVRRQGECRWTRRGDGRGGWARGTGPSPRWQVAAYIGSPRL